MSALPQAPAAPVILKHQYQKDKAFYFNPNGENFFAFCVDILNMHWLKEQPNAEMAYFLARPDLKPKRMLQVCRDSHKSTLSVNAFPVWDVCQGLVEGDMDRSHLFDSASMNLVYLHLRSVKKTMRYNEKLAEWFGDFYNIEAWTKDDVVILQHWSYSKKMGRREGTFSVRSVLSEVVGLHYTRIEADDWVTDKNTKTDLGLYRGIQHYKEILNVLDKQKGQLRISCTPWHWADAYEHIKKNDSVDFDFYIRPVGREYAPGKWDQLFFPEKFPEERINQLKRQEGSSFAPQYLMQPVEESNKLFPDEFFQLIEKKDLFQIRWVWIVYDPAGSSKNQWNRSCDFIGAFGVDYSGKNMVMLDGYMKPGMQPTEVLNNIVFLWGVYRAQLRAVLIEDVTFGKFILKMIDDYCREHSVNIPVVSSPPKRDCDKEESQKILQPRWLGKGMWFLKELPEEIRIEAKDEFMHYPKSTYNDLLDGIVMVERMTRYRADEIEQAKAETKNYIQVAAHGGLQVNADMFFDAAGKPKEDEDEMESEGDDRAW